MNKVTFAIFAFLALAAVCLVPVSNDVDADITPEDVVVKTEGTQVFTIVYNDAVEEGKKLTYSATVVDKGDNTQSNAVSPSTGSLDVGESKDLTVTAPKNTGKYTLVVEYLVDDEKVKTEKVSFKVINPIKLTVNLKAEEVTLNLEEFGVYFYIDGNKMEDSYTTITLASDGTGSVSYEWVADPAENKHTFKVVPVGGAGLIDGLDEEHTFYAHDNSYSLIIALASIVVIVLIFAAVWVYRKPVKNYGKPKSRR